MKFKPGDLVRIKSAFDDEVFCPPVAIVLKAYIDDPVVFKKDRASNMRWIAQEATRSPYVYDIIIQGEVETCISEEWLAKVDKQE